MPRGDSSPPKKDSPAWRWVRAALIALLAGAAFAIATKVVSKKVRDLTPDELRAEMETGGAKIERVIETLQRMDFEERRQVMQSAEGQRYVQKLTPAERKQLLLGTVDRGIAQQIERFHKMNKKEREEFIEEGKLRQKEERARILSMSEDEREKRRALLNDANFEEVFEKAMRSYLSVTTSEERAELAPLYEGALQNVQLIRGR